MTTLNKSAIEKVRVGKFSISTSLLIRSARKKRLKCEFLPEKVILMSSKKISHYFKGTSMPCNDAVAAEISCNKLFVRQILKEKQFPVPKTMVLYQYDEWNKALNGSLRLPLVVKPTTASHANGASFNIQTAEELHQAVKKAFAYNKKYKKENHVLVEEFVEGHDLRLLVVGGNVVSTVKRDPAHIIGDGNRTIRHLIHAFNRNWQSPLKYDFPLCPIPIDSETLRYLSRQNLTLDSVLKNNEKIYLRWNANVSTGGRSIDVTDKVHARIKALAVRVAKIFHLNVSGVDILCKNPSSNDTSNANIVVLEINDSPGLDIHHFPTQGTGRDICSDIINHIFKLNNAHQSTPKK